MISENACIYLRRCVGAMVFFMLALTSAQASSPSVRLQEVTDSSHPWTTWHCARLPVAVRQLGSGLEVDVNGSSRYLIPARSGSGARYLAPGDSSTEFWNKGQLAQLTWSGIELPVCAEEGAVTLPFRASGNEPFWAVDYDGWRLVLSRPDELERSVDASVVHQDSERTIVEGGSGEARIRVDIAAVMCADTMADLIRPYTVRLTTQGQELDGCGGDAARLLQGAKWDLQTVDGQPLAAPAWLEFLPDGQLAGFNGCNRLVGRYTVTGEGVSLQELATTSMACETARTSQETMLNNLLTEVRYFAFDNGGKLLLHSDTNVLTAAEAALELP